MRIFLLSCITASILSFPLYAMEGNSDQLLKKLAPQGSSQRTLNPQRQNEQEINAVIIKQIQDAQRGYQALDWQREKASLEGVDDVGKAMNAALSLSRGDPVYHLYVLTTIANPQENIPRICGFVANEWKRPLCNAVLQAQDHFDRMQAQRGGSSWNKAGVGILGLSTCAIGMLWFWNLYQEGVWDLKNILNATVITGAGCFILSKLRSPQISPQNLEKFKVNLVYQQLGKVYAHQLYEESKHLTAFSAYLPSLLNSWHLKDQKTFHRTYQAFLAGNPLPPTEGEGNEDAHTDDEDDNSQENDDASDDDK